MQKGISSLLIIIIVALLVILPATYWVISKSFQESTSVKGAATSQEQQTKPGFIVNVVSHSGTWDMVHYLCKSLEECSSSATSGVRWSTVSGGATESQRVQFSYSPSLDAYTHLKYFVRSSWGANLREFKVSNAGEIPESKVLKLKDGSAEYEAVIVPLSQIKEHFYTSATLNDN